ncbi:MAG: hypothetical protein M3025_00090 [Actinomycetota bacterium]|nr:hypothetical protein [Actinomycetota bacterium]
MSQGESKDTGFSAQEREGEVEKLAQQAEEQADELEQRSESLHDEERAVREDWQRKRADSSVPGTPPPDGEPPPDGAPPPDGESHAQADRSSGPKAPPEDAN